MGGPRLFAAKTFDFESSVKVKFLKDWPQFLDQDQAWSELQLVHLYSDLSTSTKLSKLNVFAVFYSTKGGALGSWY